MSHLHLELDRDETVALKGLLQYANPVGGPLRSLLDKVMGAPSEDPEPKPTEGASGPRLASDPVYKKVKCRDCAAEIEYLPEHVDEHHGTDYGGGPDGYERVKCPRKGCRGHGYIRSW